MNPFLLFCGFAGAVNAYQFVATGSGVSLVFAALNGYCFYYIYKHQR